MSEPDWAALARHITERSLRLEAGERVVLLADPYVHPGLLEAVRTAVLEAGAIDHAAILAWTGQMPAIRDDRGRARDASAAEREREARLDLMRTAQVFIWLPVGHRRSGGFTVGESEWVLGRWQGRGVHFHWFADVHTAADSPVSRRLGAIYERATLQLDYDALRSRQGRVIDAVRGAELHVTTPDGTDMRVRLEPDGWYHRNDGDASPEKAQRATCARDREEELPCGAIRTRPDPLSASGTIRYRQGQWVAGQGVTLNDLTDDLTIEFNSGRLTDLRAGAKTGRLRRQWEQQTGDKDRLTEVVIGTNPLLPLTVEGAAMPVYWAFGAGGFRFHLGDILESGGPFASSFSAELWFTDATVTADGVPIISDGRLLIE